MDPIHHLCGEQIKFRELGDYPRFIHWLLQSEGAQFELGLPKSVCHQLWMIPCPHRKGTSNGSPEDSILDFLPQELQNILVFSLGSDMKVKALDWFRKVLLNHERSLEDF